MRSLRPTLAFAAALLLGSLHQQPALASTAKAESEAAPAAPTREILYVDHGAMRSPGPAAMPARQGRARIETGNDLEVGIFPDRPFQGGLLIVDVYTKKERPKPQGQLVGQELHWHRLSPQIWRGLAPIPDHAPAGPASLELILPAGDGAGVVSRSIALDVEAIDFDSSQLRVSGKYTAPPAADQERIAKDRADLAAMWERGSSEEALFTELFSMPREDRTTAPYGTRRVFNGKTQTVHYGWDIRGGVGDEVLAPNDGIVTMASDLFYSGGTIFLDHGGGLYTGYFHLSRFDVSPGERVRKGQLIGLVGASGRVTGPHLHWAAKIGGHYIHPGSLLGFDFSRPMVGERGVVARGAAEDAGDRAAETNESASASP